MPTLYTQVPRAVMWLLRGDEATLGSTDAPFTMDIGSFYISRGCITNEQFEAHRADFERHPSSPGDADPAVGVSFREATAYADWYSALSGKAFRLPSEAEWEFACRSGRRSRYPWGDAPAEGREHAWSRETSGGTCHPVDTPSTNDGGIYGMIGNVWEWTVSLSLDLPIEPGDGRDDLSLDGDRVIRGGGFRDPVADLGCHVRRVVPEATRRDDLGFRIVRSL